jgi:hypothetical protein
LAFIVKSIPRAALKVLMEEIKPFSLGGKTKVKKWGVDYFGCFSYQQGHCGKDKPEFAF